MATKFRSAGSIEDPPTRIRCKKTTFDLRRNLKLAIAINELIEVRALRGTFQGASGLVVVQPAIDGAAEHVEVLVGGPPTFTWVTGKPAGKQHELIDGCDKWVIGAAVVA